MRVLSGAFEARGAAAPRGGSVAHRRARAASDEHVSGWLPVPGTISLSNGRRLTARLFDAPPVDDLPTFARDHALEWHGQSVFLDARA